jgi:hypothetical protein
MEAEMLKIQQARVVGEAEMRAFYESLRISPTTTEAAIKLRLNKKVLAPNPMKGKKRANRVSQNKTPRSGLGGARGL